jgi:dienelactone hydrolase
MPTLPPQNVVHLNRYHHFTELMRDPAIEGDLRRYQSTHDQSLQTVLILRPAKTTPDKLFFFFHGMDGDAGDAVIVRNIVKHLNATVVAMGGRGPAWLSDAFLADAEHVIRTHSTGQDFYLIGVSMGGTQALSLAGLLPNDLKQKIVGVMALIPGANLSALVERSAHERVRTTVAASSESTVLKQRSPNEVRREYKPGLPFVVAYNEHDTLLLSEENEALVAKLREHGHPVTTYLIAGDHCFTFTNFDYAAAFAKLGTDSTEIDVPFSGGDVGGDAC